VTNLKTAEALGYCAADVAHWQIVLKSRFAPKIKNSKGRRRGFRVKM
jgi:hypothetical protein